VARRAFPRGNQSFDVGGVLEAVEPDSFDAEASFGDDEDEVDEPLELDSDEDEVEVRPLAADVPTRESVMYQPLPLNTMPTGWMTLRNAPPHCSQVVSGGSE
jgi:hypothetical protein